MFRRVRWLGVPILLALATGCTTAPTGDGRPQIVASFYPFAYLAAAIVGSHADVVTLVPPGAEPHDYELTPGQVGALATARLVVYQAGVSANMDEAITEASPAGVVETGQLVTMLALSADGAEADADASEQAYGKDPHTWLDPGNMIIFANAIADAMVAADPGGAPDYRANAAALDAQLLALDADYRSGLSGCARTVFLTTHAAFGYLAKAYGLTQLAIAGVTPEDEPSPRHLAELAEQARADDLTTVFFETLVSPDYANTLAYDLGLHTDVLDPIEAVTKSSRGSDYLAIMQSNLVALRTANGCPS